LEKLGQIREFILTILRFFSGKTLNFAKIWNIVTKILEEHPSRLDKWENIRENQNLATPKVFDGSTTLDRKHV